MSSSSSALSERSGVRAESLFDHVLEKGDKDGRNMRTSSRHFEISGTHEKQI